MRKCRNWQTSKTKDLVIIAIVWVQVPSSALHISAFCGCSSMVEHQPSKLDTWVRFPSPALMAQWLSWLERRPVTAEVTGSSPVWVVCKNDDYFPDNH